MGATITRVDLTHNKKHDLTGMEKAVASNTKVIYICNPNNPTGTIIEAAVLKNFIEQMSKKNFIVIDEAYLEYTNEPSMSSFVANNKNVLVIKTFSKIYGLAGARIGYALAHPDTIKLLNSMQPWPNAGASACAVAGANATLDDSSFLKSTIQKNNAIKKDLYQFYTQHNIAYIESYANFIYYSLQNYTCDFAKEMEAKKIMCGSINEENGKWYRVTIGTENEMKQYKNATTAIIHK
jgi:histidinol-phosphate aminotransferase